MKLWTLISFIVCEDGADGDLDERKFSALNKYNNNSSLLTLYEWFRLLFDNLEMLGIDGFTDESAGARLFYSKLDAGRYGQLYREKMNSVSRQIDTWPQSISEA